MRYQVWTKDEFEGWKRKDCEDKEVAVRELLLALKAGKEPLLTLEIPFLVRLDFEEGFISEVT